MTAQEGQAIERSLMASVAARQRHETPYPHAFLAHVLPDDVAAALAALPLRAAALDGDSGTREAQNHTRVYFDEATMTRFPVMRALAEACQSRAVVESFAGAFGATLDQTYLRLEYAQDVDGFWLKPHTDLGVKRFTCLIYLSSEPGHETLGTDIYSDAETHVGRSPFAPNTAMVFVPGDDTWHGFEKRPFPGVRRSVILNYVTSAWRAREQLAFPGDIIRL